MPAFTFEKISPPAADRNTPPPVAKKPRSVFAHMIDRFVDARIKKNERKVSRGTAPRQPK
jgi:hypothetical protein